MQVEYNYIFRIRPIAESVYLEEACSNESGARHSVSVNQYLISEFATIQ